MFELSPNGEALTLRPYRWSQISNVLWIESPVGVGFSYSEVNNYANSDYRSANENMLALEAFYLKFPEYLNNGLFLTGEVGEL